MIAELDKLLKVMEAQVPANPNSPKNQKLERRLKQSLSKYFKSLSKAFPYHKLDELYFNYVKESLASDTGDILDPLIGSFDEALEVEMSGQIAEIYISGTAEMISWGKTQAGVPIAFEGPPIQQAVSLAKTRGAFLVTNMDEETKRRLALTISNAIQNKSGVEGLATEIRKTFDSMSRFRSQMIARTETADALSQASLDNMKGMGIDGKQWITAGDDLVSEECEANENEGVIPASQVFSGGTMAPPQHPNCRCALAPARIGV